jgi:sulfotransferase
MENIFFNSSLPRSGSSLIQNILAQNPDFYVTPTSGVLELMYAARSNYSNSAEFKAQDSNLMKKGFLSFCKKGLYGFYEPLTDRKYVVDKSRGWGIHFNFLEQILDNEPKIICMVRDPRDILASMEKNFRKNQHIDSGILNWSTSKGTTTAKRIDDWINSPPIGLAFERLNEIIKQGLDKKILFIRYEDLLNNPNFELKRIYNYFNINEFIHDFNYIEQITQEDDSVYGIFGDHKIKNKLEPLKHSYKDVFSKEENDWIYNNYFWFNNKFNYIR